MKARNHLQHLFALVGIILVVFQQNAEAENGIKNLEDLKNLQDKIENVTEATMPATVALFSQKNGASGSGVIVNENGLILTAGHVVQGAEEMTVIFPDGKQTQGKVLGANYTRDSAMVQIVDQQKKWPYVEIGSSKDLEIGSLVIAIGHAGGYDPIRTPPVRFGRITANSPNHFITTDCTLIGGDSGGPLFDLDGKLVGIHSSIGESLSSNNHAAIEGFHLDWKRLKNSETWGSLSGSAFDDPNAPVMGIILGNAIRGGGIRITQVIPNGPAARVGIRNGDILLSINSEDIHNLRSLHSKMTEFQAGEVIVIHALRGNKITSYRVKLGRRGDFAK